MILEIVKIGNSQGIRIPKKILEECGIDRKLELEVKEHTIIMKSLKAREGWEESFKKMHENGDDELLIDDNIDLDDEVWVW